MENAHKNKRAVPRAAIVGCGNIGSLFDEKSPAPFPLTHASAYLKNKNVALVAACDTDEKRLKEFGKARGVKNLYPKYQDLFKKEEIDILSVCTHLDSRLGIIKAALESGIRHIICEKPLAETSKEAKELIALAKKHNAKIAVNFIRRWNDGIHQVKEILDRKSISVQAVTIYYEKGCLNNGSHIVDLLNYFFGSDIEILSAEKINDDRVKSKDPSITARFDISRNGKVVPVQMNAVDHRIFSIFEIDILHSAGRIKIKDAGNMVEIHKVIQDPDCPEYPILKLDQELTGLVAKSFPNLIQNMVDVFHGEDTPRCSVNDALESLKMVEAIRGKLS